MLSFVLNKPTSTATLALLLMILIGKCDVVQSVEYHTMEEKRGVIDVIHEDLNVDGIISKPSARNKNDMMMKSDNDDKYGVYSMKVDKKTGKQKYLKHVDSLGDIDTIKNCIYKGERDDGAIAVYVACKQLDYLLISKNIDGNESEQIEVRKDKKSGKMTASKTRFADLHQDKHDGDKKPQEFHQNDEDRRQLAANECSLYPQKYLSLVVINSPTRISALGSNTAVEADTVAQFLTGKVSYDRMTTPLGCNVKVRLAGQLYETSNNRLLREPMCNEIDTNLAAIQISHNANSGTNGCCSTFPINWNNCPSGETKCWNANAPNDVTGWSSAAAHPLPGVDFTRDGGCYNTRHYVTWGLPGKSVAYYGMGDPYLASNSATQADHNAYLTSTSQYFSNNAASLRSLFGDVDNVQGWTHNDMHSGVAGLGWVRTQCNDYYSTAIVVDKWGVGVWLHEMGHNLGMDHKPDGIMGRRLDRGKRRNLIEYFAPENEVEMENFLVNNYGVNGGARCMENNPPTRNPTPKPTLRPDFIPTKSPTAGNGGRCDPYICGGSTCGTGNSCWRNGLCYDWTNGVGAWESCEVYACNPNLSCHPDTRVCTPCSGTASPTVSYIPGGGIGAKCNADQCGASTCDPKLTCDSDGFCKKPGNVAAGGICRENFCQQGLTCNRVSDTCIACAPTNPPVAPPTKSPTTKTPTTTNAPVAPPTNSPVVPPTKSPTTKTPTTTNAPVTGPTNPPVAAPTNPPVSGPPTTKSPTNPTTKTPSKSPTTPTGYPTTLSPTTEAPTQVQNTNEQNIQGPIIGGVVGGAVGLIGVASVFFCVNMLNKRKPSTPPAPPVQNNRLGYYHA